MYRRILVPTDGSEATGPAVEHALDLAETCDAALHVLYVVDADALPLDAHAQRLLQDLEADGRESVADVVDAARERGIDPVVGDVETGTPHEEILDYVDRHGVDLVVMGTHGRSGIERYLLGSVTDRVIRLADVPVLTVRMVESAEPERE